MIELDFGPAVMAGLIVLVFVAPVVYGMFIDNVKK
jgi:hypothetical protein